MNCAKCGCGNPPSSVYCNHCLTPLTKDNPDTSNPRDSIWGGIKKPQDIHGVSLPSSAIPKPSFGIVLPVGSKSDKRIKKSFIGWLSGILFIVLGFSVMGGSVMHYMAPSYRLWLYGTYLRYRTNIPQPTTWLIEFHTEVQAWTLRSGLTDTALSSRSDTETATILIDSQPDIGAHHVLRGRTNEWMRHSQVDQTEETKMIPQGHPTMASATVILDSQGTLLERQNVDSLRLGRALIFSFPRLPKGILREGSVWSEPVRWGEDAGDWKFAWEGQLKWRLADLESCGNEKCARLDYEAVVTPRILQPPDWAIGDITDVSFSGNGQGEAIYNIDSRWVVSNVFALKGDVTVGMKHLENVSSKDMLGSSVMAGPGTILLQINSRLNMRKP